MVSATAFAPKDQNATASGTRRCLVTGALRPKDELIRFVIAPGGAVVPDLSENLPGRGLWVTAERGAIDAAARSNLFAKGAGIAATPDPGLADTVAQLFRKRCLDWLGLARGAGIAVLGQPQVETALKAGKLALLLIARDAAANGLEKIPAAALTAVRHFTREELGGALGYGHIVYVGLKAHGLTEKLRLTLARLEKIAGTHDISKETGSGTA